MINAAEANLLDDKAQAPICLNGWLYYSTLEDPSERHFLDFSPMKVFAE
jgi:hypothetical protein